MSTQAEMFQHNYEVHIQDWNGNRTVKCDTEEQAWEAIGNRAFGGLYQVTSPTGLNTYQFIPY